MPSTTWKDFKGHPLSKNSQSQKSYTGKLLKAEFSSLHQKLRKFSTEEGAMFLTSHIFVRRYKSYANIISILASVWLLEH